MVLTKNLVIHFTYLFILVLKKKQPQFLHLCDYCAPNAHILPSFKIFHPFQKFSFGKNLFRLLCCGPPQLIEGHYREKFLLELELLSFCKSGK